MCSSDLAQNLNPEMLKQIRTATLKITTAVGVKGLINIQFAVTFDRNSGEQKLFVLEANPRASRTVPFVSKATGIQLAKAAALIAIGKTISDLRQMKVLPNQGDGIPYGVSVKEAVLPWNRFRRVDGIEIGRAHV